MNVDEFSVERARLEVDLPLVCLGCALITPCCWVVGVEHPPLPAALVLLFFNTVSLSRLFQTLNLMIIECCPESLSAANAVINLIRCLLGVALVEPLLDSIGRG